MRLPLRHRAAPTAETITARLGCLTRGHRWDSARPAGPIHVRDICWGCGRVRRRTT